MATRRTGSDSRRWAARLVVLWPVLVTIGYPAFALAFGMHAGHLFGLALLAGATVVFARFGFLGLAAVRCMQCRGRTTVGQLYCPHCDSFQGRVYAPTLQVFVAGVVLPTWFLLIEGFIVTVVGALLPLTSAVAPLAEFYRAFAFGADISLSKVLFASAVVPLVVTTLVRASLRMSEILAARQPDTS